MDACARTLSVAKACISFRKHKIFIGCKLHPSCVIDTMLQLILLYTRLGLSIQSDNNGEEEFSPSIGEYVKVLEVVEVRKRLDR